MLKFYPVMQLSILHNFADFYWNSLLFLKIAQKQSRSSIFATQPLRPALLSVDQMSRWSASAAN